MVGAFQAQGRKPSLIDPRFLPSNLQTPPYIPVELSRPHGYHRDGLNPNQQGYEACLFHPEIGNEVVHGRIVLDRWTARFESETFTAEIPVARFESETFT